MHSTPALHRLFACTACLLLPAGRVLAAVHTLEPIADSFVQASTPTTNFGTNTKIYVANRNGTGAHQDGLLRFDLASIPAGQSIVSATLKLTVNQQNGDTQTAYLVVDDTWGETAVTWSNRPATGSQIAQWTVSSLTTLSIDFTAPTQTQFAGDKKLSFYIKGTATNKQIVYWSGEYGTVASRPQLVVTTSAVYSTVASLNAALATANPGDTLTIANGTYSSWEVVATRNGTAALPITIAAQTTGSVIFTGTTQFRIDGSHTTIRGFRFDRVVRYGDPDASDNDYTTIVWLRAPYARVTECSFGRCGQRERNANGAWRPFDRIVGLHHDPATQIGAHHSRIDRNYFFDSRSVSVGIMVRPTVEDRDNPARWPANSTIEFNWFHQIPRASGNGQEAIQLATGGALPPSTLSTSSFQMFTNVTSNYFFEADGDEEICSIKCSDNTVSYNTFSKNIRGGSGLTIRGGSRNKIIGNFVLDGTHGLRVYGDNHKIINNYLDANDTGIIVYGVKPSDGETAVNCLFAFNTVANSSYAAKIDVGTPNPTAGAANTWYNNILRCSASGHAPVYTDPLRGTLGQVGTWNKNILWSGSATPVGWQPPGSIWANPQLTVVDGDLLRPAAASPAINAGIDLRGSPWLITTDVDGHARNNATPEIGADEIYDNVQFPPQITPLTAADVGPLYLNGVPWVPPVHPIP